MSHNVVMNGPRQIPHHHPLKPWLGERPSLDHPSCPVLAWFSESGSEEYGNYMPEGWYLWTVAKGWVQQTTLQGYRGSHGSVRSGAHRVCAYSGKVSHPTTEGAYSFFTGEHSSKKGEQPLKSCQLIIIDHRDNMWTEPAHFASAYDLHRFKYDFLPEKSKRGL